MAYIGGGADAPIDWIARDEITQLRDAVTLLERRVQQLEAKLASTTEALDTVAGAA